MEQRQTIEQVRSNVIIITRETITMVDQRNMDWGSKNGYSSCQLETPVGLSGLDGEKDSWTWPKIFGINFVIIVSPYPVNKTMFLLKGKKNK